MVCDRSVVLVVNGSQQALDLVARVPEEPGTREAIEDPLTCDIPGTSVAKHIGFELANASPQYPEVQIETH